MAKKSSSGALIGLIVGVLCIFIGLGSLGLSLILNDGDESMALVYDIIMYGGIGVAAIGVIATVISVVVGVSGSKGKSKSQGTSTSTQAMSEPIPEVNMDLDGSATYSVPTSVSPTAEKYEFVTMGRRQSLEEKFDQINKMGKTQFVIYMAKLFSLKGFEVQLTPVIENHCIDMIVKKDGVTRAVGCLLSNKVLCAEDVTVVNDGKTFYNTDKTMVVTNMFFDRTSLEFAKSHSMVLIDRNVLSEQYMN